MQQKQLENFRTWFDYYVATFYGDDRFINANLKMKEEHSRRVCDEMLYLADQLGFKGNQRRLAEVIALFHDIGRFEQFVKYQTYNDPRSINHCLLGLDVLRRQKTLQEIDKYERELIEKAIEYHGLKELPEGLDDKCLLYSRLIRDADKLDVYYVVNDGYQKYRDDPEGFELELELPDGPDYSSVLVEDILHQRKTDYAQLRTLNDMKLLQLGWVYDINFTPTLIRIKQHKFLEKIAQYLPKNEEIEKVRNKIFEYVDKRIEGRISK